MNPRSAIWSQSSSQVSSPTSQSVPTLPPISAILSCSLVAMTADTDLSDGSWEEEEEPSQWLRETRRVLGRFADCGVLLGVAAEECRPPIEPKPVNVGLVIGDRRESLGNGGSDLLCTVTSRIKGYTPVGEQSKLEMQFNGGWQKMAGTY